MNFSKALELLKEGFFIQREGWNGKGMYLFYNPGSNIVVSEGRPLAKTFQVGTSCEILPYIMMKTTRENLQLVPWLASQTDILAEDWCVLGNDKEGILC